MTLLLLLVLLLLLGLHLLLRRHRRRESGMRSLGCDDLGLVPLCSILRDLNRSRSRLALVILELRRRRRNVCRLSSDWSLTELRRVLWCRSTGVWALNLLSRGVVRRLAVRRRSTGTEGRRSSRSHAQELDLLAELADDLLQVTDRSLQVIDQRGTTD
jgi:hypothetical protein